MSVSFLRYHRRHGHIEGKPQGPKFIKLGHKSVRYLPEDLKQWLRNNRCDYEEDRSKERFKPRF
ncbi:MAG: DNA-binding protein [Gammaproteobacteria bacterium]